MQGEEFDCDVMLNATIAKSGTGEWLIEKQNATTDVNLCNLNAVYYDWWYPYHYPSITIQDTTKKAFSIVKKLMDKKIIQCRTVKQFVDLVDIISKELE